MSKTKNTIEKLSEKARNYLEYHQSVVRVQEANGNNRFRDEHKKKIAGYLDCLQDFGKITESERHALYLFYATM